MNTPTLFGLLAILLWSSTIGFSRSVSEALGPLTSGFIIYILAGLVACLQVLLQKESLSPIFRLPKLYLFGAGAFFVSYEVALYLSIGLSQTREQVLVVGLINYLWPVFILISAIPILNYRASPLLGLGIILAVVGMGLALGGTPSVWLNSLRGAWLPYLLMFYGALAWSLYTNLSRRWIGDNPLSALPLFFLCTGITLGIMRLFVAETWQWSLPVGLQTGYLILGTTWLAYTFWDTGSRRGNIILLTTVSYLIPLFSTWISSLILNTPAQPSLWIAAGLIIAGSVVSRKSVREPPNEKIT
jgi:drug/metabolite transporter (DMT)-like permease